MSPTSPALKLIIGARAELPREALALDLAQVVRRNILVCGEAPMGLIDDLRIATATVTVCTTAADATVALGRRAYDVVAVQPDMLGGIELVKALKLHDDLASRLGSVALQAAVSMNRSALVFVMPLSNEIEYAIIVEPPFLSFIEKTTRLRLADAILRLDISRLVAAVAPK